MLVRTLRPRSSLCPQLPPTESGDENTKGTASRCSASHKTLSPPPILVADGRQGSGMDPLSFISSQSRRPARKPLQSHAPLALGQGRDSKFRTSEISRLAERRKENSEEEREACLDVSATCSCCCCCAARAEESRDVGVGVDSATWARCPAVCTALSVEPLLVSR